MLFGDAHIEHAFRIYRRHGGQRAARSHSRRDAHNLLILLCQFQNRISKNILEFRRLSFGVGFQNLACIGIEKAWSVVSGLVRLGQTQPLAFHGDSV